MSIQKPTLNYFYKRFPDGAACLKFLFESLYGDKPCPKCKKNSTFKLLKLRKCYQCSSCSLQIHPTVGTIFENSHVSLSYWFFIIYLHSTTRNGIAAKEIERITGVTYKTALRMAHKIKTLMVEDFGRKLTDYVMVDETYVGMKAKNMHGEQRKMFKRGETNKTTVMGFMEKGGLGIYTKVLGQEEIPAPTYRQIVMESVDKDAVLITDAFPAYKNLVFSFPNHVRVDHTRGEYVKDGHTTNPLENYWSTLKRMIKGTHIHVSRKHLPKYIAENTFRYVRRNQPYKIFDNILEKIGTMRCG